MLSPWLVVALGYLLGSVLPAEWAVRRKTGRTPHELGDNPGGAGTWRLAGPLAGALVTLFDVGKGAFVASLAERAGLSGGWLVMAAVAPVVGHNWPWHRRFRGGRGLGPATGVLLWLAWRWMLPAYVLGALAAWWRRWVPMVGIVAFPVGLVAMHLGGAPQERLQAAFAVCLAVAVRQLPWALREPQLLRQRLGLR